MNTLMIVGTLTLVAGIFVCCGMYYKLYYKSNNRKYSTRILCFVVLVLFTIAGGSMVQKGQNQLRLDFKPDELALLHSGKSFSDFTEKDQTTFATIKFRRSINPEEKVKQYYETILNWEIDDYLIDNKHREGLNREDVRRTILKNWATDREFVNNYK